MQGAAVTGVGRCGKLRHLMVRTGYPSLGWANMGGELTPASSASRTSASTPHVPMSAANKRPTTDRIRHLNRRRRPNASGGISHYTPKIGGLRTFALALASDPKSRVTDTTLRSSAHAARTS